MPDLTPDVTTTPNFDPGRVAIASGWLGNWLRNKA